MSKKKKKTSNEYDDFVPYNKSSKKEKRDRDKKQRNTWDIPPCEKIVPDKKKEYKRKHKKDDYYNEDYE